MGIGTDTYPHNMPDEPHLGLLSRTHPARVKANVANLDWDHRAAQQIAPLTFPAG